MHVVGRDTIHYAWDRSIAPVMTIGPGDEVTLELRDAADGQLTPSSTAEDVARLDRSRANPVSGPVSVAGAAPGDALIITVLDLAVASWGWTANIPGFGLLAADFPDAHLAVSQVKDGRVWLPFGIDLPVLPMIGTMGVAPPEPGRHSVIPPSRYGGNLDIRHIVTGARLKLPVGVGGALVSAGDAHAAMGDGEICGTGLEVAATARLRIHLEAGDAPTFPLVETPGSSRRRGPALATTGVANDLLVAARDAARGMIDEIVRRTGLAPVDAYLLMSLAGDLVISEVVNASVWVVSLHAGLDLLS